MARKPTQLPQPRKAELTADQIKLGITKIQRRLEELEELLGPKSLEELEREARSLLKKIDQSLSDIFQPDTDEYYRYGIGSLGGGGPVGAIIVGAAWGQPTSDSEYIRRYHEGINGAIATLRTAKSMLQERLEDMGASPAGKARRAIDGLDLHRDIEEAAGQLYRDGHYSNAVLAAANALTALVKSRSGYTQDGVDLMNNVFSLSKPVLKFNDLQDESDRNEQKGFMMLFSGAVTALRNPRAHKRIEDDPEEAIEFIAFISLLAKRVAKAKKA